MAAVITLGIETATTAVSVALGGDDGVLGSIEINRGRRHAEVLTPAIQFVCRHAQIDVTEIGAIGVDVGPGLFTGMRVGLATANVMSRALRVPVVGVSSLDLLANEFHHRAESVLGDEDLADLGAEPPVIASVIDARKDEVFVAFFRRSRTSVVRVSEPRACSIDDFNAAVAARAQRVVAVGDGAWRYRKELHADVRVTDLAHPSAVCLVRLARPLALAAESVGERVDAAPMYLREPDAQINWSRR